MSAADSIRLLEQAAAEADRSHPPRKPRDAASLLLIDRSGAKPKVLVGKRGKKHVFMPDLYVFPGGRRDAGDSRIALAVPLERSVEAQLLRATPARFSTATARGLAVAAAREMLEEASVSLTPPDSTSTFRPDVSSFRFIARAITPPGESRRFDTRFFACFVDEVGADPATVRDSEELQDLTWVPLDEPETVPMPRITSVILSELVKALADDSSLPFGRPVPFYSFSRGRRTRILI
ncbi:hypothetical protein DFR52_101973 [Hoeflea marina]|uniref:Nudix hydrolase domain-containing protein n=1 Tax=Hoeflea marina TaxID=274592 RepID=A0A317PS36_9HYPH|nr:NUDIX hydrolase [Hoeflea marina]PWW04278.1 hypothetical protein DFR52_101973 [Hoeflea marina]